MEVILVFQQLEKAVIVVLCTLTCHMGKHLSHRFMFSNQNFSFSVRGRRGAQGRPRTVISYDIRALGLTMWAIYSYLFIFFTVTAYSKFLCCFVCSPLCNFVLDRMYSVYICIKCWQYLGVTMNKKMLVMMDGVKVTLFYTQLISVQLVLIIVCSNDGLKSDCKIPS